MADEDPNQRVARYVRSQMAARGWDVRRLAVEANIDAKTAQSVVSGKRWPQTDTRAAVEQALEVPAGVLEMVRNGWADVEETPEGDPVELAIYQSALTRANQLKLAGIYYEMLEAQKVGQAG